MDKQRIDDGIDKAIIYLSPKDLEKIAFAMLIISKLLKENDEQVLKIKNLTL